MKNLEDRRPLWDRAGIGHEAFLAMTVKERLRLNRRLSGIGRFGWFIQDCRWFIEDRIPRRRGFENLLAAYRRERADRWAIRDRFGAVDFGDGEAFK